MVGFIPLCRDLKEVQDGVRRTDTIKFLTLDETKVLFSRITEKRDRVIFLTAHRHGLRASEVDLLRM